jgi:signal transduction histidine kinase
VQLHIADNGRGIPLEEQQKVFSTFYQVDPDFTGRVEGMGLGLSLSKRLVEEHKGHIEIHSKPGEGSIFTISLPTVNQPPA